MINTGGAEEDDQVHMPNTLIELIEQGYNGPNSNADFLRLF